ncbi:MAG TPA: sugar phosphate isomerase/epimerase family protein [Methylomirabilota bacterium]|jgi:sugar phosphate isomerase/epimerase|nr:sugar phosphate isomerase/epimerase family protein [Methylomirabilota bacterium]
MKLGCICGSFNRSFDAGIMDQFRFLERCAGELRVEGAELQDIHFPQTRPAYLGRLRRAAADAGLALIGLGVHNDFGRADTTWRQSEMVKVKQWIEVAETLGVPQVRVFAGHPEGPAAERWPAMIAALREVADFAAAAGVRLGLENHNHGAFTRTAAEEVRILEEVNHPALRHLLDTGNYVDGWPSVERTAPLAVHVHAKFWQVDPTGAEPTIDYPRLLALLRRHGYAGWITFEYEAAEPEETGIPRALAYLRRLLAA